MSDCCSKQRQDSCGLQSNSEFAEASTVSEMAEAVPFSSWSGLFSKQIFRGFRKKASSGAVPCSALMTLPDRSTM